MITDELILSGKTCPYCGKPTIHCSDSVIYGRTYGSMMYVCRDCDAYVGCHRDRPQEALGRLADAELRHWKIMAHKSFDSLWRRKMDRDGVSKTKGRKAAYKWLSDVSGIDWRYCHIGMFDVAECQLVIEVCKPFVK